MRPSAFATPALAIPCRFALVEWTSLWSKGTLNREESDLLAIGVDAEGLYIYM